MSYKKLVISESLELPNGKSAMDMPYSHYRNLAKKVGYVKVVRSLGQLAAWNTNKNPELAEWARDFQNKLKKDFKKHESVIMAEGLYSALRRLDQKIDTITSSKIMDYASKKLSSKLGVNFNPNKDSYQREDPELKGEATFEVYGGDPKYIFDSAVEAQVKTWYDKKGKVVVLDPFSGSILLLLPADLIDDSKITQDPKTIEGASELDDISSAFRKGFITINSKGAIVGAKGYRIANYNNQVWVIPSSDDNKSNKFYKFKSSPPAKVLMPGFND